MAEGLAVLGGLAASMQLAETAAKGLLGAVKLVKQLKEIPKKTAIQLEDVERSLCLPEPEYEPSLSRSAERLVDALNETDGVLRPLMRDYIKAGGNRVKTLWREVVMFIREADVAEKLDRVRFVNDEFLPRGFQRVEKGQHDIAIQGDRMSAMVDHNLSNLRDDIRISHGTLQDMIRQQDQRMTEERRIFRNELLDILKSPEPFDQCSSVLQQGITAKEREELEFDTRVALLRNPNDLQDAFALDYDDLAMAIIRRSYEDVCSLEMILSSPDLSSRVMLITMRIEFILSWRREQLFRPP
ncbi:hypothetical protein CORC01_07375 [Colletotrichum orchidophilum]|uniref:Fungal N-terminal domain-containing protein n=1 Tax=Colletotrichum orchidophilum TaxID=1209926 RepID=A0A1G4B791_9PEZI|nr:uncharacterized protein CORC01_07375 [Colletotrichum orchidophilum]OHE97320.1 hypothetical protein CORC01_07375 [Colletotrichum orchidophilum]